MNQRVDPGSDRAVFRQIADQLRDGVVRGVYPPGSVLPSESKLMAEYGVSRVTVRRALAELEREALAMPEHGRGWVVRRRPPVRRLGSDRFARRREGKAAFTVDMEAADTPFTVDVLFVGEGRMPGELARLLGVRAGTKVVVRRRLYLAAGQPVELATSYIPLDVAEGTPIAEVNPGPGGIYARMEDKGFVFDRYEEEITARVATEEEARVLSLPVGSPVLHLVRVAIANGRPVEVCDTVMDASAFVLHYTLPAKVE